MRRKRLSDRDALSQRLRETREALGYQVAANFAKEAGISASAYNNYENGFRIGLDAAVALCETYDLSLDWIYFGEPAALLSMPAGVAERIKSYYQSRDGRAAAAEHPLTGT